MSKRDYDVDLYKSYEYIKSYIESQVKSGKLSYEDAYRIIKEAKKNYKGCAYFKMLDKANAT